MPGQVRIFSTPSHLAFADSLALGLLDRYGASPLGLAPCLLFLPNHRAIRAVHDAFVRHAGGGGLLLPRMIPVSEADEDELPGDFFRHGPAGQDLPDPIAATHRRLLLAQKLRHGPGIGARGPLGAPEALRLGDQLARMLDELEYEGKRAADLQDVAPEELARHWQVTLDYVRLVADVWPQALEQVGLVDVARRRNMALRGLAGRWRDTPPAGPVIAAGITTTAGAVCDLLSCIARLENGFVLFAGLDHDMSDAEWDAIGGRAASDDAPTVRGEATHPQYALRCLLRAMGATRDDVQPWAYTTPFDGSEDRAHFLSRLMTPARFTDHWIRPDSVTDAALSGVRLVEAATPDEEAQVIALALRRQLETPGRTAALVTPDRSLARRVCLHMTRWGIKLDDSAGTPLRATPPGAFFLLLAQAAAARFTPETLLAILKHPLVHRDARPEARLGWLDRVRELDLLLRGVRAPSGLDAGVTQRIDRQRHQDLATWWDELVTILTPLDDFFVQDTIDLGALLETVRATAQALAGDAVWAGQDGRALADLVTDIGDHAALWADIQDHFSPDEAVDILTCLMNDITVRPAFGTHPRLAIYGLVEARMQRADCMILGGLNESSWPMQPPPDPWLAPAVRKKLGLPDLDRRIGMAAHDFVHAMGGRDVLVTRARRDDDGPTIASRFWLRLTALGGDRLVHDTQLLAWARALDMQGARTPAARPNPAPPADQRPRELSVTQVDLLRADPFSFYARHILRLNPLDGFDLMPAARERGIFLHDLFEKWIKDAAGQTPDSGTLKTMAEDLLHQAWGHHPLMMALWAPRMRRALDWLVDELGAWSAQGWRPLAVEAKGTTPLAGGVALRGRADRIDVNDGGALAIIDYKTGSLPDKTRLLEGYALQLALLARIAENGGFAGLPPAPVAALRYWKTSGGREAGTIMDPALYFEKAHDLDAGQGVPFFTKMGWDILQGLCDRLLLGDDPFIAKAHPLYAQNYSDFDHLARTAEWIGRDEGRP